MNQKIFNQSLGFIIFIILIIILKIHTSFINDLININFIQNNQIKYLVNKTNKMENNYNLVLNYIQETSEFPNEKRKAIFKLKIQQDSVLMSLLQNDIQTNQNILNLLDDEWKFNNETEFESLKIK